MGTCSARQGTGAWLNQRSTSIDRMALMGHLLLMFPIPELNSASCLDFIPFSLLLERMPSRNTNGTPATSNPQQPHQYLNPHLRKAYLMAAFPTHHCCSTTAPMQAVTTLPLISPKICMAYLGFSHCSQGIEQGWASSTALRALADLGWCFELTP